MVVQGGVLSPVRKRQQTPFDETFGVSASEVLTSIADAGDDPVAAEPRVGIALRSVGYTRSHLLIQIDDPFRSGPPVQAIATVRIGSGVPGTRRGLHLSRLGDAVARSVMEPYPDLTSYARTLASAVSRSQYGRPTAVDVRARIPYVEEVTRDGPTPVKLSLEHLRLLARVCVPQRQRGSGSADDAGLQVSHLIACPCVQRVYQHTRALSRRSGMASARTVASGPASDQGVTLGEEPGFTHSQRCTTTVLVRGLHTSFPVRAVLEQLDAVLVRTMSTLPRGSELSMVHAAHARPQFIEDALREALWAIYTALDGAAFTSLHGRSTSAESIHDFDLSASATLTCEAARRCAPRPRV